MGMKPEVGAHALDVSKLTEADIEAAWAKVDFKLAPWLQEQIDAQIDNQGDAVVVEPPALPGKGEP